MMGIGDHFIIDYWGHFNERCHGRKLLHCDSVFIRILKLASGLKEGIQGGVWMCHGTMWEAANIEICHHLLEISP